MKNLILISLAGLLLTQCKSANPVLNQHEILETYRPEYLKPGFLEVQLKAGIEAYGNHFGGLVFIKKIKSNHYRIAITTEIGAKLMDFEVIDDEFKINFVPDALNRKKLLELLALDFRILLKEEANIYLKYTDENNQQTLTSKFEDGSLQYSTGTSENILNHIAYHNKNNKEKSLINLEYAENHIFPNVTISHNKNKIVVKLRNLNVEL